VAKCPIPLPPHIGFRGTSGAPRDFRSGSNRVALTFGQPLLTYFNFGHPAVSRQPTRWANSGRGARICSSFTGPPTYSLTDRAILIGKRDSFGPDQMGERSRAPETEKAAEKTSLRELNGWISIAEFRATKAKLSASLKKSAMKRLVWLEGQREKLHGVPAPKRNRF
jgi:hypothetical protein